MVSIDTFRSDRSCKNKDCFPENFPPRRAGVTSLWLPLFDVSRAAATNISRGTFLHLPAMPNRFITRITVIAFHKSPPRGVGMLRFENKHAFRQIFPLPGGGRGSLPPPATDFPKLTRDNPIRDIARSRTPLSKLQ
jgi:hypothetical protein